MRKKITTNLLNGILVAASLAAWPEFTASAQSDWATFWTKFKTAVVKNDKKTVLSLSEQNLSDEDYKILFGARARQNCFAKAKPVKDGETYSVFCGGQGYYFEKVNGQFKFKEWFADD